MEETGWVEGVGIKGNVLEMLFEMLLKYLKEIPSWYLDWYRSSEVRDNPIKE